MFAPSHAASQLRATAAPRGLNVMLACSQRAASRPALMHASAAGTSLPSTRGSRVLAGASSRGSSTASVAEQACQEAIVGGVEQQPVASSSGRGHHDHATLLLGGIVAASLLLGPSGAAHASEGNLTGGALELFKAFLDQVETLGPLGVLLFIVTVMLTEMVPLFPTQPLSLASGLLFGSVQGSIYMLIGVTLAAVNAYSIAKGVGRPLAERVIKYELGGSGGNEHGVGKKLAEVEKTIEQGGFWQQFMAILLLRLTPVVPFSASNYILGLTPVQFPAFVGGTIAGMSVWAVAYSSLGGASRSLLDSGKDIGVLFAELAEQSGSYSKTLAGGALAVAGVAALWYFTNRDAEPPARSEIEQIEEVIEREEVQERLLQKK